MVGRRAAVLIWVWVVVFFAAVPGCRTPRGPYSPITREDEKTPHQMSHGVTMLDKNVRDALLFINRTAKRLPSGQVQVRVQMQNLYRNETLWSDVRVVFYDEDEMGVDQTEWQKVSFPAREIVLIQGTSLRNDIKTYNVQFKNLRSRSGRRLSPPETVAEHGLWKDSVLPE
jgi:hypothetical protein